MRISVGITSHNQRDFLIEAVESVLDQTFPPAEVWIVDDASADDSPQVVAGYARRYPALIRPILLTENIGVNGARNQILDAATGDYLSFLDGDDRWLPRKLERETQRLAQGHQPEAVFGNYYFTDQAGNRTFLWTQRQLPPEGAILPQVLTLDLPRNTLFRSELVPTALWRQAGYYDPTFAIYGDWDMRVRLASVVQRFAYVDEPLCEYRRHGAGLSSRPIEMHLAAVAQIESKYADLIARLAASHESYLARGFSRWRAKLLRHAARDLALRRPAGFRGKALAYYRKSLAYHPVLDPRLLWYLVRP